MEEQHFELDINESGRVRLYWAGGPIWEGSVPAIKELERMLGAFNFHHEFSPSLFMRISIEEAAQAEMATRAAMEGRE